MEPLCIYMLGPPRVTWRGHPLTIPRRQTRALLYRLAARLEPVPREQLCFLLWPDVPESTARRNLSRLLSHLDHALPTSEILLIRQDDIAFRPDDVWSDTVAFERLCEGRASPAHRALHPPAGRIGDTATSIACLDP